MRTYFQDFARPDGSAVTVEYTFRAGSPDTYSPAFGADGGDPCECEIVKAFNDAAEVTLPDDERERYEEWIIANVQHDDYEPD